MRLLLALLLLASAVPAQDEPPPQAAPAASEERVYKKLESGPLKLHLYPPEGWKPSDRRPAIVFFFGGGWAKGTVKQFAVQAAALAGRGMVAACADYRVKERHASTPDQSVEDAKSAVRWMRRHAAGLGIDPDRIVAAGGSAGGHLAACTAILQGVESPGEDLSVSSKADALVLFNPVMHLEPLAQRMADPERARKITPNLHLAPGIPPAILFYGDKDPFVESGREFVARMKELGGRAEIHVSPGQVHGFFNRPPFLEETLRKTDEFLVSLGYLPPKAKE